MSWLWLAVAHAVPTLSVPSAVDGQPLVVEVTGAAGPVAVLASTGTPLPPGSDLGPTLRLLDAQWLGAFTPGLAGDVTTSVTLPPGSAGRTFTLVAADSTGPSAPVVITVAPDPLSQLPDSDLDGLPDALEDQFYAFWYDPDTDDDGLLDGDEVFAHHTSPSSADSDSDGLGDAAEVSGGTDPTQWDTDGGGASDGEEATAGTDPHDDADDDHAGSDYDQDGLPDRIEELLGTRLWDPDCDQDGLLDGAEVFDHGTDPRSYDSDWDGLSDPTELQWGTDPVERDTDGGGATDREEWDSGTDPHDDADDDHAGSDYDQDGLPDRLEDLFGLRLWDPDFDQDGLLDGAEVFDHATDPRLGDTDFGGEGDGSEVANGRDPLVAGDDTP